MADYDWSSKDNPELQQKMNEAVDQAVNDYLGKIKSGEISFPDNLQLEMDKIGNKTRHDMLKSQSDAPDIFSETLQEGLDKSNIQQKQKRSREQELLDEMNQTRLSNEDWLKQADERQLTAESPLFLRDFSYDVTAPQTKEGIMQAPSNPTYTDMDDLEGQDINRQRMEDLMRLASMEQYPTQQDEQGNWLTPGNIARGVGKFVANKALGLSGVASLINPLGWASALTSQMPYRGATSGAGGYTPAQLNRMNALGGYYSEPARNQRRTQSRIDYMMARRAAGKDYSETNLKNLLQQTGQEDTWQQPKAPPPPTPRVPDFIRHGGGGDQGGVDLGKQESPSDAAGTPFNRGGLAALWQRY